MDDYFDIGRVFEIGKFDITRLTCTENRLGDNHKIKAAYNVPKYRTDDFHKITDQNIDHGMIPLTTGCIYCT